MLGSILNKYSHDRFNDREIRIFENINNFEKIEIKNYNSISHWNSYLESLKTQLQKPDLIPGKELNGIGVDDND